MSSTFCDYNTLSNYIQIISESVGIPITDGIQLNFLTDHILWQIKALLQDAEKYSRHAKRTFIIDSDINRALIDKNIEPLYGFGNADLPPSKNITIGNREFTYTDENKTEIDLNQAVLNIPKLPLDSHIKAHWLCVEGVQPLIPENISPASQQYMPSAYPSRNKNLGSQPKTKDDLITVPVSNIFSASRQRILHRKHALRSSRHKRKQHQQHPYRNVISKSHISRQKYDSHFKSDLYSDFNTNLNEEIQLSSLSIEQQLYYKDITEACVGSEESKRSQSFQSLASDPGLHALLPRFINFITRGVRVNLMQRNLAVLIYLMRMARALLENPHLLTPAPNYNSFLLSVATNSNKNNAVETKTTLSSIHSSKSHQPQSHNIAQINGRNDHNENDSNRTNTPCSNLMLTGLKSYAHLIAPAIVSCCMCDIMCQRPESDNHWALRDFSAKQLGLLCKTVLEQSKSDIGFVETSSVVNASKLTKESANPNAKSLNDSNDVSKNGTKSIKNGNLANLQYRVGRQSMKMITDFVLQTQKILGNSTTKIQNLNKDEIVISDDDENSTDTNQKTMSIKVENPPSISSQDNFEKNNHHNDIVTNAAVVKTETEQDSTDKIRLEKLCKDLESDNVEQNQSPFKATSHHAVISLASVYGAFMILMELGPSVLSTYFASANALSEFDALLSQYKIQCLDTLSNLQTLYTVLGLVTSSSATMTTNIGVKSPFLSSQANMQKAVQFVKQLATRFTNPTTPLNCYNMRYGGVKSGSISQSRRPQTITPIIIHKAICYERVSCDYVRQALIKCAASLFLANYSLNKGITISSGMVDQPPSSTTYTIDELKGLYGPSLGTMVYNQLRKQQHQANILQHNQQQQQSTIIGVSGTLRSVATPTPTLFPHAATTFLLNSSSASNLLNHPGSSLLNQTTTLIGGMNGPTLSYHQQQYHHNQLYQQNPPRVTHLNVVSTLGLTGGQPPNLRYMQGASNVASSNFLATNTNAMMFYQNKSGAAASLHPLRSSRTPRPGTPTNFIYQRQNNTSSNYHLSNLSYNNNTIINNNNTNIVHRGITNASSSAITLNISQNNYQQQNTVNNIINHSNILNKPLTGNATFNRIANPINLNNLNNNNMIIGRVNSPSILKGATTVSTSSTILLNHHNSLNK